MVDPKGLEPSTSRMRTERSRALVSFVRGVYGGNVKRKKRKSDDCICNQHVLYYTRNEKSNGVKSRMQ